MYFLFSEHLKQKLEDYISRWNGIVKLFRNERREGLIRARSIGAEKAVKGKVLLYLDAHCEVGYNWLPPLITPIALNRYNLTSRSNDFHEMLVAAAA